MTLEQAYLVAVIPAVISAIVGLPLTWWKPYIFGPLFFYVALCGFVCGSVMMNLAR